MPYLCLVVRPGELSPQSRYLPSAKTRVDRAPETGPVSIRTRRVQPPLVRGGDPRRAGSLNENSDVWLSCVAYREWSLRLENHLAVPRPRDLRGPIFADAQSVGPAITASLSKLQQNAESREPSNLATAKTKVNAELAPSGSGSQKRKIPAPRAPMAEL